MSSTKDNITHARQRKVEKLIKDGIKPYLSEVPQHELIDVAVEEFSMLQESSVALSGRLLAVRLQGSICFAVIKDATATMQLLFSRKDMEETYDQLIETIDTGDFIWVKGELFKSKAGMLTMRVKAYQIVAKAILPLPSVHFGIKHVTDKKQWALQLAVSESHTKKIKRSITAIGKLRAYMLQKDIAELSGFPVYTLAAGFERSYEIYDGKFYCTVAYTGLEDMISLLEESIDVIVPQNLVWQRVSLAELLAEKGLTLDKQEVLKQKLIDAGDFSDISTENIPFKYFSQFLKKGIKGQAIVSYNSEEYNSFAMFVIDGVEVARIYTISSDPGYTMNEVYREMVSYGIPPAMSGWFAMNKIIEKSLLTESSL